MTATGTSLLRALLVLAAVAIGALAPPARAAPAHGPLVWSDEFHGLALDPANWTHRAPGPRHDGILTPDAVSVGDGKLTIKTYTLVLLAAVADDRHGTG